MDLLWLSIKERRRGLKARKAIGINLPSNARSLQNLAEHFLLPRGSTGLFWDGSPWGRSLSSGGVSHHWLRLRETCGQQISHRDKMIAVSTVTGLFTWTWFYCSVWTHWGHNNSRLSCQPASLFFYEIFAKYGVVCTPASSADHLGGFFSQFKSCSPTTSSALPSPIHQTPTTGQELVTILSSVSPQQWAQSRLCSGKLGFPQTVSGLSGLRLYSKAVGGLTIIPVP